MRYQCQRCFKTYKSFRWAKKHVCRVRKSTSTRVRCDDCGKYFKTTALLKKHQCTRITPAWCEYCNFMTNGAHVTDIPAAMRHSYGPEPALDLSKIRESLGKLGMIFVIVYVESEIAKLGGFQVIKIFMKKVSNETITKRTTKPCYSNLNSLFSKKTYPSIFSFFFVYQNDNV